MTPNGPHLVLALLLTACQVPAGGTGPGEARTVAPAGAARARPNVVLILADDMGIGDIGALNTSSRVPTPNLDRLVSEGAHFTDAHSPSAVCTPTRYGILTGRYPSRRLPSGVLNGRSPNLIDLDRVTLPELLSDAGYRTACVGKWHLGLGDGEHQAFDGEIRPGPLDHGFDHFFGIPASLDMEPYLFVRGDRAAEPLTGTIKGSQQARNGGGGFWRAGQLAEGFRHVDVLPRVVDEAVDWIGAQRTEGEPFFLYLPLPAPHTPWLPTEAYQGASGAGVYGDFAAMVDGEVGRVLAALDAGGHAADTLVLFTADNGAHWTPGDKQRFEHRANGALRGQKADIHEGGHRVPMIARWPGQIAAGSERPELFGHVDFLRSLCSLVGIEVAEGAGPDSFDLSPLLSTDPDSARARPHLVHLSLDGMLALREGRWKFIDGVGSGGFTAPRRVKVEGEAPLGQLYDLNEDPAESRDLAAERPEVAARLRAKLHALLADESTFRPSGIRGIARE